MYSANPMSISNGQMKCGLQILCVWVLICVAVITTKYHVSMIAIRVKEPQQSEKKSVFIPREFRWIDIQKSERAKYFTEYELKSVDETNPVCDDIPYLGKRCCIGGELRHTKWSAQRCSNKNIFRRFDFSPLSEDEIYSMTDIAMKLDNNSIIVSAGDSITGQVADMMQCNLYNHGYEPESYNDETKIVDLEWERKYCNKATAKCVIIRWVVSWYLKGVRLQLHNFCDWGDVYLINWSLHNSLNEEYATLLNAVFGQMKSCDKSKNKVFVWRERSAQHFFNFAGYHNYENRFNVKIDDSMWSEWYEQFTKDGNFQKGIKMYNLSTVENMCLMSNQSESTYQSIIDEIGCWPIAGNDEAKYAFRNFVMNVSKSMGIRTQIIYHDSKPKVKNLNDSINLFFIPFKEVTYPLWDQHPGECTHYCTTSHWAEYIFHTLYLAINVSVV